MSGHCVSQPRRRTLSWIALTALFGVVVVPLAWPDRAAWAQDAKAKKKATARAEEAPAKAADAAPADTAATPAKGEVQRISGWRWMLDASGPMGIFIVILSIYMIAMIVRFFMEFTGEKAMPPDFIKEFERLVGEKKFQDAFRLTKDNPSFLAKTMAVAMSKLSSGFKEARAALGVANEDITMKMEHRTTYLATLGTLGPMLGLIGTVIGMILSFQTIATAAAQPKPQDLARGISMALFITLEGIILSVPAIFFFAYFRNRIARLSLEVALLGEDLLTNLANAVRASQGGAGGKTEG